MRESEPLTVDLLAGALDALRHQTQLSQREGEIKRGIVEAERRNDVVALLRLKQEKLELGDSELIEVPDLPTDSVLLKGLRAPR